MAKKAKVKSSLIEEYTRLQNELKETKVRIDVVKTEIGSRIESLQMKYARLQKKSDGIQIKMIEIRIKIGSCVESGESEEKRSDLVPPPVNGENPKNPFPDKHHRLPSKLIQKGH